MPMRPPGSVYFTALLSRLANTCARRTASASTSSASGGSVSVSSWRAASISGRLVSTAAAITSARSTMSLRSSILPRVMRDTSIRSSTRRTMWLTWRSIISHIWPAGPAAPESRSRLTELRIGASGLRSSWASVARNSSLRRSASSRSRRCARVWYWRSRARSALRTALASAVTRTGRSSSVTLPSVRSACATAAESAPGRVSTRTGRSDHGGWRCDQLGEAAVAAAALPRRPGSRRRRARARCDRRSRSCAGEARRPRPCAACASTSDASLPTGARTSSRRSRRSPGSSLTAWASSPARR